MAFHAASPGDAGDARSVPSQVHTLDQLLDGSDRDGIAVVDGAVRYPASAIRAQAAALSAGLRARGVGRGDVVAWQLPNWHEAIVLFRACWLLGAIAAPLHHRHRRHEIAGQLSLLRPRAVLTAPGLAASGVTGVIEVRGDGGYEDLLRPSTLNGASALPVGGRGNAGGPGIRGGASDGPFQQASGTAGAAALDDPAVVLFTSGSVDEAKGVVHTHRSLGHKAATMPRVHGLTATDVVLMPAPLAHISGLLNGVLVPGAVGMKVVLMEQWDPVTALRLIAAEGVSFMAGPPTFFRDVVESPSFSAEQVTSLRVVSCGGTGVTPAFVEHAGRCLDARVKRTYGSTEAPTVAAWHDGDPPDRAVTSDGRAVGDVELRIVAPDDTGDPPPSSPRPGQVGELWVRGPEVFAGYLGIEPSETFTADGWFRTGDLATLDEEGWLTVVGRCGEVIIRGGENIAPAEVEAVLEAHPAIQQAVAVGLPDDRFGEVVAAAIVAHRPFDLDACRGWFAERGVARFKTPAHLLCIAELPRLGSGKPDRRVVRERLLSAVADESAGTQAGAARWARGRAEA